MTANRANAVALPAGAELLATLLATPLPRGMRCAACVYWQRDPNDGDIGYCVEQEDDTLFFQGCVYWQPRPDSGLDYMGVPLASPLAQED